MQGAGLLHFRIEPKLDPCGRHRVATCDFHGRRERILHGFDSADTHHAINSFVFDNGAFIHYGLGNLFFDQMDMLATRQTFVDTYVIYDGRLLSVELWTGLIENWARPRLMTPEERADLLQTVFAASGW